MHDVSKMSLDDCFFGSVTVGERGQVVIPAEARKRFGFEPGDKLLVFCQPHGPGLMLARVDEVHALLGQLQQMAEAVSSIAAQGHAKTGRPSAARQKARANAGRRSR